MPCSLLREEPTGKLGECTGEEETGGKEPMPSRGNERGTAGVVGDPESLRGDSVGEVVLYSAPDGTVTLNVRLEGETIWLTQRQMAELFDKDSDTIGRHLKNVFADGELDEEATTEESSVVQWEGNRQVQRRVRTYNLDAILSVGYRVNSKLGTQFRIWATGVLRDHLVRGYTTNQNRLRDLNQAVRLITETASRKDLTGDEAQALLAIVGEYNRALDLLDDYDHQRVVAPESTQGATYNLEYEEAEKIVGRLRSRFGDSGLFGIERDQGLETALSAITQAWRRRPPTSFTSSSRIMPLSTGTSGLQLLCFYGSLIGMERY